MLLGPAANIIRFAVNCQLHNRVVERAKNIELPSVCFETNPSRPRDELGRACGVLLSGLERPRPLTCIF